MSGIVAIEGQLNGIIKEFLDYFGFEMTLEKFNEECNIKGKLVSTFEKKGSSTQKINFIINEMIHLFNQGQRKEFFRKWIENVPIQSINDNIIGQKIELELNIYFAIFPLRKGSKDSKAQIKESMNYFKNYIETKGPILCKTKEFLPYFSLPYSDDPQGNFPEIFTEAWKIDLQNQLENFLKESLKIQNQPRLVELYTQQIENSSTQNNFSKQASDADKKAAYFFKKFNRAQADYHSLIGITAELVDSLENTIIGKPVSTEYLTSIINRLFNAQFKQSVDFTRPGTAGDYIRKSLAYQKSNMDRAESSPPVNYPPLDYGKIEQDLIENNERRQLSLLQALRWRLTRCETSEQRQKVLTSYIAGDLLNCRSEKYPNHVLELIKSPNDNVKQYMVRLINTIASLNHGRSYLASNNELIKLMHIVLKNEKECSITQQNLLAALQKLSLRRNMQIIMINDNMAEWLINLLEKNEELTDYSLEYATALLMNLSLRHAGRKRLAIDYKKTLKVVSELIGNTNTEIRSFVNGTLYSILNIPEMKAHAKAMNLENILKGYLAEGNEETNRQIEFIIKQINSNESNPDIDSDNEDADEDDEEDPIAMEAELDRGEIIIKQYQDEVIGETLLLNEYSINNEARSRSKHASDLLNDSVVLSRPTTPSQLRQSMFLQTKQFSPSKNEPEMSTNLNDSFRLDKEYPSKNQKIKNMTDSKASFTINRSQSVERKQNNLKQSNTNGIKSTIDFEKKTEKNILVIDSADSSIEETDNVPKPIYPTNKLQANDSNVAFASRPKIQRTPDQSIAMEKKNSYVNASRESSNSLAPKYSIAEPRPSSANSSWSKNSSSSGTLNQNDSFYVGSKKINKK